MKVEQRIGRIDRIGQRYDNIEVLNLATIGSVKRSHLRTPVGRLRECERGWISTVLDPADTRRRLPGLASGDISHDQLEQEAINGRLWNIAA